MPRFKLIYPSREDAEKDPIRKWAKKNKVEDLVELLVAEGEKEKKETRDA